jgi:hypothetical protein
MILASRRKSRVLYDKVTVLLMFPWLLSGAALLVAGAALARTRKLAKRLERLTESYWELRYEHGQLRARVNRVDPDQAPPPDAGPAAGATAFVPLSSLKR